MAYLKTTGSKVFIAAGTYIVAFLLIFVFLNGCATPPNVPVFEDLPTHMGTNPTNGHIEIRPSPACEAAINEPACGHGVYIIDKKEIYVGELKEHWFDGKPWSQLKAESVLMPAKESYAPVATFTINQCKKANCSDQIDKFNIRLDELKEVGPVIGNAMGSK